MKILKNERVEVYVDEVIVPITIIAGFRTRIASLLLRGSMVVAVLIVSW